MKVTSIQTEFIATKILTSERRRNSIRMLTSLSIFLSELVAIESSKFWEKADSAGLAHPRTILKDPAAAAFVGGVAFHHYEGQPSGMTRFHEEFPRVPIRFTEGSARLLLLPILAQRWR